MVSSLSAARAIFLVLLTVFLLLLFLYRCGSTISALCCCKNKAVKPTWHIGFRSTTHSASYILSRMKDEISPGGFLRMNVQSLCLVSSMPRYPQALQELPMVCFLGLTCWWKRQTLIRHKHPPKTYQVQKAKTNVIKFWPPAYEYFLTLSYNSCL